MKWSFGGRDTAHASTKTPLQWSIEDARTLLAFASSSNVGASIADLPEFGAVIEAASADDASAAVLENFWTKYRSVAQALAPVTAQSIRATRGLQSRKLMSIRGGVASVCVAVFLTIVAIQVVWGYGTAFRLNLDKQSAAHKELYVKQIAEKGKYEERKGFYDLAKGVGKSPPEVIVQREKALEESQASLKLIQNEIDSSTTSLAAAVELYRAWYSFEWRPCWVRVLADLLPCKIGADQAATRPVALSAVDLEKLKENGALLTDGLQRFGLSIMMGLLGTLVYLLREIEDQVKSVTYRGSPAASMFIRCVLGMVGGMFGTLFMPADLSNTLVKGLPAMGLSFLVGYSVELFFAFLDKIVGAFKPATSPGKA